MAKNKGPSRLILLRHAEKTGHRIDPMLSEEGVQRAHALVDVIPEIFGPVEFLIAAKSRPTSARPFLTLLPLSENTGLRIEDCWDDNDVTALAAAVLKGSEYAGLQGLICWRHDALPALARALGVAKPPIWSKTVYDRFWVLDYKPKGVKLTDIPQGV